MITWVRIRASLWRIHLRAAWWAARQAALRFMWKRIVHPIHWWMFSYLNRLAGEGKIDIRQFSIMIDTADVYGDRDNWHEER